MHDVSRQSCYRWAVLPIVIVGGGGLTLIFAGILLGLTPDYLTVVAQSAQTNRQWLTVYLTASFALWAMLTYIAVLIRRGELSTPPPPGAMAGMGVVLIIFIVACAARVGVVLGGEPRLSDDIWRYIDDGHTLAAGRNPYAHAPTEGATDSLTEKINHPDLVTIYQPTSQWVFACLAYVSRTLRGDDARVFRLGFVLIDLGVIALLIFKLRRDGRRVWWATLYAWHPLAISETAGAGHQDVIGIACLLMCLMLTDQLVMQSTNLSTDADERWWRTVNVFAILSGVALALAIGVKPLVGPLVLPMVFAVGARSRKRLWIAAGACVVTLAALYVPFVMMDGGVERMIETLRVFMRDWSFNGSLHRVLSNLVGKPVAGAMLGAGLLGVLIVCIVKRLDLWRTSMVYLLTALLFSSTVYPWYLLWVIAIVPIRFSVVAWVFSLSIVWSYAVLIEPQVWVLPQWVLVIEYAAVYVAIGGTLIHRRQSVAH